MSTASTNSIAVNAPRRGPDDLVDRWVLISVVTEYTGYTDYAVRAKIRRGQWPFRSFWRRAPDGRLVFNLTRIQRWMSSATN